MLSAYAPQRGSRLSGKTREGISQGAAGEVFGRPGLKLWESREKG